MLRLIAIVVLMILTMSLSLYGNPTSLSLSTQQLLRQHLERAKEQLGVLNTRVADLEEALSRAKASQQASQNEIESLQKQLETARQQQRELERLVRRLESQLTQLSVFLTDLENEVTEREKTIQDIKDLVRRYERSILIWKIVALVSGVFAVGAGGYVLLDNID